MKLPAVEHVHAADEIIRKTHGFVFDSAPAVINGEKGWLGFSRLAWYRVWFDSQGGSRTFLTCATKAKAAAKFKELKAQYGV